MEIFFLQETMSFASFVPLPILKLVHSIKRFFSRVFYCKRRPIHNKKFSITTKDAPK